MSSAILVASLLPAAALLPASPLLHADASRNRHLQPVACSIRPAPPAPPPVAAAHGYGGGDDGIVLRQLESDERLAMLSLWAWQYEAMGEDYSHEVQQARFMTRWIGDQRPSGWFGRLHGCALGAFVGDSCQVGRRHLPAWSLASSLPNVYRCCHP